MSTMSIKMYVVTLLVLVSAVSGKVNSTVGEGGSRMTWLRGILDHHDWLDFISANHSLPQTCENDVRQYVTALRAGKLWASKIFDASGQYSPNVLFGSEYWLGSINACRDLLLKKYYQETPPFDTTFYVAKINLIVDQDHIPKTRPMLVGQCVPVSCSSDAVKSLLVAGEARAVAAASAFGISASLSTLYVRPVPGSYNILEDRKFHILGIATVVVATWILLASLYEGYLERKYSLAKQRDLENANNNTKDPTNNTPRNDGVEWKNSEEDSKSNKLAREVCGLWSEVLLSFSALSNGRSILNTQQPSDGALTCLHGMRFMSVSWVIMVHTYLTVWYVSDNKTMRAVTERNFLYQSVGNASYCVDTFFFISGLLVTILFLRTEDSKKQRLKSKQEKENKIKNDKDINKNINGYANQGLSVSVPVINQEVFYEDLLENPPKGYSMRDLGRITKEFLVLFFYRVSRLTPAYAFVIGVNELALRVTHDHTVFEPATFDHINCANYWWRNLLYINNLYPQREMCMVWSWYMANDTQFYVVGIILLLISVKHIRIAMVSVIAVLVSSWVTTIYISVWHQYKARISEPFEMFDPLYDKPWSRIGPYIIGMIVGWYLHRTKCQVKMPAWVVAAGWTLALTIIGVLIFGMVDGYFEVWPTAFYISVGHTGWGIALGWMALACCTGHGGLINSLLSYNGFLPLSRLTYCAYLIHPTIMMYSTFLLDGPMHLENSIVIALYAGYAVMAFIASFFISLAFEAPIVRLLKIANGGTKRK
ncbi:nose resistant to fluoxetine protein 6-like [Aricia agestis]|uniref:nose resistant to fluoxetine protein 6-like n=1 Tax=Aricia agestis TaxID=91739 RepID=UPI001C201950|nr:nose resistant to fluoxetine protein 6-like [Aricia agestis]